MRTACQMTLSNCFQDLQDSSGDEDNSTMIGSGQEEGFGCADDERDVDTDVEYSAEALPKSVADDETFLEGKLNDVEHREKLLQGGILEQSEKTMFAKRSWADMDDSDNEAAQHMQSKKSPVNGIVPVQIEARQALRKVCWADLEDSDSDEDLGLEKKASKLASSPEMSKEVIENDVPEVDRHLNNPSLAISSTSRSALQQQSRQHESIRMPVEPLSRHTSSTHQDKQEDQIAPPRQSKGACKGHGKSAAPRSGKGHGKTGISGKPSSSAYDTWSKGAGKGAGAKLQCQFIIGIEEDASFQVVRRIIGGGNMKRIAGCSGAKLRLRGRGSKFLEGPEQKESDDDLMLCVSCHDARGYAEAQSLVSELLTDIYAKYRTSCRNAGKQVPDLVVQIHEGYRAGSR